MTEGAKREKLAPWWVWALIIVGVPLVAVLFAMIIVWGPGWLTQQGKASDDAYLKAITDNRTALVQAVGGFAVFLGVIAGAFTLRHNRQQLRQSREDHESSLAASRSEHEESLRASRDALEKTLEFNRESLLRTVAVTERGQITDRFSKAIEQLGQAGENSADLRLGGIYALEQIAKDSADWYQPVVEVLAAFVRQHASGAPVPAGDTIDLQLAALAVLPVNEKRVPLRVDIAAAIDVLGRRNRREDPDVKVDFHGANFCRVNFPVTVNLEGVDFGHAYMPYSHLMFAKLRNADFLSSELQGANLQRSDLSGARMFLANFYRVDLSRANLRGANLSFVDLRGANLSMATLDKADMQGAKLQGADLASVDLSGVINLTIDQLKIAKIGQDTKLPLDINKAELDAAIAALG